MAAKGAMWKAKGYKAAQSGLYGNEIKAWNAQTGKPGKDMFDESRVTAHEHFYAGWMLGKRKAKNPTLPRGKWITAKVRVTKNGTIEARVPRSAVKNPFDGIVLHTSTKKRRK